MNEQTSTPAQEDQSLEHRLAQALDQVRSLKAELAHERSSADQARALAGRLTDAPLPLPDEPNLDLKTKRYITSLEAEIAALHNSRLFRTAAPARRVWARIRAARGL